MARCSWALSSSPRSILRAPGAATILDRGALLVGPLLGALLFPLGQTIVGSADGTPPFFGRLRAAYRDPRGRVRGLVIGLGLALAYAPIWPPTTAARAFSRCCGRRARLRRRRSRLRRGERVRGERREGGNLAPLRARRSARRLVAGALGWYFDTPQLHVVIDKFWAYADVNYRLDGRKLGDFTTYPIFNKYGMINLGEVAGGVRLFWAESVAGVINWSLAAPLFSINYVLLDAALQRSLRPIKTLLSPDGVEGLVEQGVRVLRWGLWMAPVINSFLRQSPDPTWYNQDGAIRTGVAIGADVTPDPADFRQFSLAMFTGLLAYDWLRILIWFDHMGLRVATLVNLSFLGGDRADEAAARFVGQTGARAPFPTASAASAPGRRCSFRSTSRAGPNGTRPGPGAETLARGAAPMPERGAGRWASLMRRPAPRSPRPRSRLFQGARQDGQPARGSMARRLNLRGGRTASRSTMARWASRFSATVAARPSSSARSAAASRSTFSAGRSIRSRRAGISSM